MVEGSSTVKVLEKLKSIYDKEVIQSSSMSEAEPPYFRYYKVPKFVEQLLTEPTKILGEDKYYKEVVLSFAHGVLAEFLSKINYGEKIPQELVDSSILLYAETKFYIGQRIKSAKGCKEAEDLLDDLELRRVKYVAIPPKVISVSLVRRYIELICEGKEDDPVKDKLYELFTPKSLREVFRIDYDKAEKIKYGLDQVKFNSYERLLFETPGEDTSNM